jgi:hypothetical protein
MGVKFRRALAWEWGKLRCCARRGPKAWLECEKPALHLLEEAPHCPGEHAARNSVGAWVFWRETVGAFEERVGTEVGPVVLYD